MVTITSPPLFSLLHQSSSRHSKLCPRQVLGVRMGLYAAELLDIPLPNQDARLLVILETDGCFADGVGVATGCSIGQRTLRIEDYGKVAATFVDAEYDKAVRLVPAQGIRERAFLYAEEQVDRYQAQLEGYQIMPEEELFTVQLVALNKTLEEILSYPGLRVTCSICGEEIINQREIFTDSGNICRACYGERYYYLT